MAGIELINVHKQYVVDERPVKVLNGISLKIPEKHITVILGRMRQDHAFAPYRGAGTGG